MSEEFRDWYTRFLAWVKDEPVRAAESVRGLLFALTAILATFGAEIEATAISGGVTALFSIYASQTVRNKVSPVEKVSREASESDPATTDEVSGTEDNVPV